MKNISVEQKSVFNFQAGNGWCNCNTFIDAHVNDKPEVHVKRIVLITYSQNVFSFKN